MTIYFFLLSYKSPKPVRLSGSSCSTTVNLNVTPSKLFDLKLKLIHGTDRLHALTDPVNK